MDSYSSKREVEKPKPAKVRAGEMADKLDTIKRGIDPHLDFHSVSSSTLNECIKLLRELSGSARG